jgi:integrase
MKTFNRYQDIVISYNEDRERWYPRLGPLGIVPARPMFKTKAEASDAAKAAYLRWRNRDAESLEDPVKADITVEDCLTMYLAEREAWAEDVDKKYGWASYSNDQGHVAQINKVVIDNIHLKTMKLSQLTKTRLEATWAELRRGVAFRTSDDRYQRLKSALKLAVKRGYLKSNPSELCEISRPDLTEERILKTIAKVAKVSWDTLDLIVKHTAQKDRLKVILTVRAGLRAQELIALKIYKKTQPLEGGIDFETNIIHVRKALKKGRTRGEYYIGSPKSTSGIRNIPIDPDLSEALKSYWDKLPKKMKAEGFLFPSEHGTHLDPTNLRERVLYRACDAVGIAKAERPTWHDLRHAFATTYLNKRGDNWKRAMELMGHGDIRTTLLYTHVVHDPARDAKDAEALSEGMPFDLGGSPKDGASNVVPFKKAS